MERAERNDLPPVETRAYRRRYLRTYVFVGLKCFVSGLNSFFNVPFWGKKGLIRAETVIAFMVSLWL